MSARRGDRARIAASRGTLCRSARTIGRQRRREQPLGVTQTEIGVTDLPGAGLPMSTRSARTISPLCRVNDSHGLGIRPKVCFWMG